MKTNELIADLERVGVQLWEDGGQIRFRAPKGVLNEQRLEALKAHKQEVLSLLRQKERTDLVQAPAHAHEPFPLTDVQSAYLFGRHDSYGYGGVACHMYVEIELPQVDTAVLESAWNALVARHPMLRTVIDADGAQRCLREVPHYTLRSNDARGADEVTRASLLEGERARLGHQVFAAAEWPLFELAVTQVDASTTVLHFSHDFIIADWASIQILLNELVQLSFSAQPLAALDLTFRDYVLAERGLRETSRFARDHAYWWDRLDELPGAPELATLDQAAGGTPRFRRFRLQLRPEQWGALRERAALLGITASGAVLAAYAEVIGRWAKSSQFLLNLTLLNRLPLHEQVGSVVGDFTSINLLAIDGECGSTFGERASAMGAQLFDDIDHRLCSGIEVLRELARRRGRDAALMPIVFTSAIGVEHGRVQSDIPRAKLGYGITQTPQVWIDCQAMDSNQGLSINWDVRDGVFPEGMVEDMFQAFERLLIDLAESDRAWHARWPIGLPSAQVARHEAANDTVGPLPLGLLHEPFLECARAHPERLAVRTPSRDLTYGELLERASALAITLRTRGLRRGQLVAVVMDKGWEQVVAVYAVLLAGGAYLPVDTTQPPARRARILCDAEVRIVLSQPWLEPAHELPEDVHVLGVEATDMRGALAPLVPEPVGADDLAYVIYTSGSTGAPKGVMITHRAARNTVDDINRRFAICAEDRALALANLGFDLSVYDLFGVLGAGASLVLPSAERRSDPSHWGELVQTQRITLWNSVPAQLQMLEHYIESEPALDVSSLRLTMLSGDWIPLALPERFKRRAPRARVVSLGGATEAAIWSIYHEVERVEAGWQSIPYGRPLTNQSFHVLDGLLRPCPDWQTGELYIGGAGLALGYLGDPERTAARFLVHPETGKRLYRTGDLGRYRPNGEIEFLGREDLQVKVRGHRIELAEVEAALLSHPALAEVVVLAHGADALHRRLVAFLTVKADAQLDQAALLAHVAQLLPDYMVPSALHVLSALPLTSNGKVDRKALSELATQHSKSRSDALEPPATDLERRLAGLWAEVLGLPSLGVTQDFFQLGGDSLLAAKLVARMRERIPEAATLFFDSLVREMLPSPTVRALASRLQARGVLASSVQARPSALISPFVALGGPQDGPVCVLVHDVSGQLSPYRGMLRELTREWRVYGLVVNDAVPYLRVPLQQLIERRAATYARLLIAHELEKVHVVGHESACGIALSLAAQLAEQGVVEVCNVTILGCPATSSPEFGLHSKGDPSLALRWPEIDLIQDAAELEKVTVHTRQAEQSGRGDLYLGDVTLCVRPGRTESEHPSRLRAKCIGHIREHLLASGSAWCLEAEDAPQITAILRALGEAARAGAVA